MIKRLMISVGVVTMLIALYGCSSSDSSSTESAAPRGGGTGSANASRADAQLKYAECMRKNGIDMPDPQPGQPMQEPTNADPAKLQQAEQQCRPILQRGGGGAYDPSDPKVHDALVKFAECMRKNGVNMPDPGPDGKMQVPSDEAGRAKFQQAQTKCRKYMPGQS